MSTDTLDTVPQLDLDGMEASLAHTPQPPSAMGTQTPRSASGRRTPKRVSYPGEDTMESTLIYDAEDAPSLSTGGSKKTKGKGKGKKSKDKSNKAEQKRK